jgi:hypothetical protein
MNLSGGEYAKSYAAKLPSYLQTNALMNNMYQRAESFVLDARDANHRKGRISLENKEIYDGFVHKALLTKNNGIRNAKFAPETMVKRAMRIFKAVFINGGDSDRNLRMFASWAKDYSKLGVCDAHVENTVKDIALDKNAAKSLRKAALNMLTLK